MSENNEFVKFHKITLFSLPGCGKKTFIQAIKKFNNPNYDEDTVSNHEDIKNTNTELLSQEIENIIVPLYHEKLYLKFYISNLENIDILKENLKYLIFDT